MENWQDPFYSAVRAVGWGWPIVFFVSWIIFGQFILLSLFLAIVLSKFEEINREQVLQKQAEAIENETASKAAGTLTKSIGDNFPQKAGTEQGFADDAELGAYDGRADDPGFIKRAARFHQRRGRPRAWSDEVVPPEELTANLEDSMATEQPSCIERLRIVVSNKAFSITILAFILLSCIELGFESPANYQNQVCSIH